MNAIGLLSPMALIALAPLAAAIIVLYLLKLRRQDVTVPSIFLWRQAVEDVQANAPFQRLRRNLLLLLQLLALTCLILALGAPFVMARRLGGKSIVIVLDGSASMRATDVAGSRFEEARRRALQVVNAMGRSDQAAVVMCAARAWVAMPFSADRRRLVGALTSAAPTDSRTNMRDGLLLALSLAAKRPGARVYVISDGAFPALPEIETAADLQFLRVGSRNDNAALLAFEATRVPGSSKHQVFVRVQNGARQKAAVLSIYHEDELLEAERLELGPGENHVATYDLVLEKPGLLRAELDVEDDLGTDNVAYAYGRSASALSILLVTPGNLFLEQALLVLRDVDIYKMGSLPPSAAAGAGEKYDVLVFDGVAPPSALTQGAVLLIRAGGPGMPAELGGQLKAPTITGWEREHPALRYVNFAATQIARANTLEPSPGATVLASAGQAPVIVAEDKPGLRAIVFGWSFLDSDLPLRVGFPVLLRNCVRWLTEGERRNEVKVVRPGEMLRLMTSPEARTATVVLPDRQSRTVAVTEGQATFAESDWVGLYRMAAGEEQRRWAVDLRDASESDLTPQDAVKIGSRSLEAGAGPPTTERHLWPYLALLGLLILLGEWHLYHRR